MKLEITDKGVLVDGVLKYVPVVETGPGEEWPQVGDYYWIPDINGDISKQKWEAMKCELEFASLGNLFPTREHAERHVETLKTLTEYRKLGRKFRLGEANVCVVYEVRKLRFNFCGLLTTPYGFASTYFDTEADLKAAIIKVGEDRLLRAARYLELGEV